MIAGVSLGTFYLIPITSLLLIENVLDIAHQRDLLRGTNQWLLQLGRSYFLFLLYVGNFSAHQFNQLI